MPITPRHSLGPPRSLVARPFTDRQDLIEAFDAALRGSHNEQHHVLVYFGVGGIGKTTLRKELVRRLEADYKDSVHAILDFDVPTYRDMETGLFVLRKTLSENYKV
ncbi:MAG: hypothetical protein ABIK62_05550, partial [candidate division WOR-3 bacterium]